MKRIHKGTDPKLLILSGMHGNEFDVIDSVTDYISLHQSDLPDFIYVPRVSPSAVQKKTRVNKFGNDINREFTTTPKDPEARDLIELIRSHTFSLCLDFHEDPDLTEEFYMYDTGTLTARQLKIYRETMLNHGFRLHSGIDDLNDDTLGYDIENGYVDISHDLSDIDTGFASGWMIRHSISKRVFTLEVPGKASIDYKRSLVDVLFSFFLTSEFMIQ